ncbi:MAG: hypothetical protein U5M53_02280 [Rhodoferax sp.]|nr:hypothetical protein [Rhodoferax sp.]
MLGADAISLAEMSPALPHTGGAYSFARTAMGPWGGFLTGLSENVEYVITPAVIVYFISSYMGGRIIRGAYTEYLPLWWIGFYIFFVGLAHCRRGVCSISKSYWSSPCSPSLAWPCSGLAPCPRLWPLGYERG